METEILGSDKVDISSINGLSSVVFSIPRPSGYCVCVRKAGDPPDNMFDGELVYTGEGIVTDKSLIGGRQYFYLLHVGEKYYSAGPVEVFPPVVSSSIAVTPKFVSIVYMKPHGADSVEISRSVSGGPAEILYVSEDEGSCVYMDEDIRKETEYTYTMTAVYGSGRSEAVKLEAKLDAYPEPIRLDVFKRDGFAVVRKPSNPMFELYFSVNRLEDGSVVAGIPADAQKFQDEDVEELPSGDIRIKKTDMVGLIYPIYQKGDMSVIGYPAPISMLAEVTNVKFDTSPGSVQVSLDHPKDIVSVLCMYNPLRMPDLNDLDSERMTIYKSSLDVGHGAFKIPTSVSRLYVKIFCKYPSGEYSDGYEKYVVLRSTIVRYRFVRNGIVFNTDSSISSLPAMVIYEGEFSAPRTRSGGRDVASIPQTPISGGTATVLYKNMSPGITARSFDQKKTALFPFSPDEKGVTFIYENP